MNVFERESLQNIFEKHIFLNFIILYYYSF